MPAERRVDDVIRERKRIDERDWQAASESARYMRPAFKRSMGLTCASANLLAQRVDFRLNLVELRAGKVAV